MSRQYWKETLYWATSDGTTISSSATETIIFPNVTITGNYMSDGRTIELEASGRWGNVVTAVPTLTFAIRWGGVSGTVLCQSPAIVTPATATTAAPWYLKAILQTRANGSSGSIFAMGWVALGTGTAATFGTVTNYGVWQPMTSTGTTVPAAVTVDLTGDTALSLTAKYSASNAANSLTGHMYKGDSCN
jgi:hypothetical protein